LQLLELFCGFLISILGCFVRNGASLDFGFVDVVKVHDDFDDRDGDNDNLKDDDDR
jgi:hypothetical protein